MPWTGASVTAPRGSSSANVECGAERVRPDRFHAEPGTNRPARVGVVVGLGFPTDGSRCDRPHPRIANKRCRCRYRAEEWFCSPLIGWRGNHSMAQWHRMAWLWCDEGTSIAGNPNSPARAKPEAMNNHHASRDREPGRNTSAPSRAMGPHASVIDIAAAAHAPNPAGICNRQTNATRP